ncbi:MAG: thioredoxin family protein [Lentisphaerota bacterium]
MKVQILGAGCPKCKTLAEIAEKTLLENGFKFELEKVTDVFQIMKFRVMSTPALAIDGKVKASGRIPSPGEIIKFAKDAE